MTSGTPFEQGEIVLVPFPFTNLRDVKKRPVLILSNEEYNYKNDDVVTCAITSNLDNREFSVLIGEKDLIKGKIPVKSRVKADKLFTLEKSLILKKVGKLNGLAFTKVKEELGKVLA
jgi:mRNA interferase MazF